MAKTPKPQAKVLDDGTVMLFGIIGDEWDGVTAADVVADIAALGDVEEIKVIINSLGGEVAQGLAIIHALNSHKGKVSVEIAGVAASMASAIAMVGDTVRMARNAHMMIHDPWLVSVGNAVKMRHSADMLERFGTSLVNLYAEKSGLEEDEIREMMAKDNGAGTWLTAEEAKAKGFVDEIVAPAEAAAFALHDVSTVLAVPTTLTQLIRQGKAMTTTKKTATGADDKPQDKNTPADKQEPEGQDPPKAQAPDSAAQVAQAIAAERARVAAIQALAQKHELGDEFVRKQIADGADIAAANAAALDALVTRQSQSGPSVFPGVRVGSDERDKWLTGMAAWLIIKSGQARLIEKHTDQKLDAGEFRGMTLLDIARESLHIAGTSTRGMSKNEIARAALGKGPRASAGLGTRSDFPVLLENVLHKMLLAAYGITPDTWRMFCATGSVSDFKPHPRLRLGSLGTLSDKLESGEFKQKHFPDAEKESIQAATKGNIIGLTREAIVNDDVDGFSRLVTMLGRAAALSIEVDVYATLALNSGLGPAMADGNPLFHARTNANNIGTGAALTASAIDADRVTMANIKDPEGHEFLDLRPAVLLVPLSLGSTAREINAMEFNDESNRHQRRPNSVRGLFREIVDTPRLSGTRRYLFADPAIAPVLEVVFLDGQASPQIVTEEGFDYDGIRWRVLFDYGVGATDFRGAVTNAGA